MDHPFTVNRTNELGAERALLQDMPKDFSLDALHQLLPESESEYHNTKADIWRRLSDACRYHNHAYHGTENDACGEDRGRNGAIFFAFLRACMEEVRKIDEAGAHAVVASQQTASSLPNIDRLTPGTKRQRVD